VLDPFDEVLAHEHVAHSRWISLSIVARERLEPRAPLSGHASSLEPEFRTGQARVHLLRRTERVGQQRGFAPGRGDVGRAAAQEGADR